MKYRPLIYRTSPQPEFVDGFVCDEQIRIYSDCVAQTIDRSEITILLLVEPDEIYRLANYAIQYHTAYNYIFTHNSHVLKRCSNAVKYEMGYTWIYDYEFKEKLFGVTSVFGHKKKTYGHQARHALWARRGEIFLPSKYFISSYGGPDGSDDYDKLDKHVYDKKRAFSCQYHIAIENSDNGFYFSEKLIDCFQTKVVPIYWGTPNIGNYFNPDGMLIARSIDEIIEKANSVQHDDYERMLPAIEENYERSKQWCLPPDDRLITKLRELIQ